MKNEQVTHIRREKTEDIEGTKSVVIVSGATADSVSRMRKKT